MITSLSDDLSHAQRRANNTEFEVVYNKLNNFIDKVNEKINSRIQLVQQVYLEDYKEQVSIMSAELKAIRGVLDEEILKQRSNEKLFYLEEERDFFRAQVIKLNEDLRKLSQENSKLKTDLNQSEHECSNYKKIVYDLETRIYKLTYENLEIDKLKSTSYGVMGTTTVPTLNQTTHRRHSEKQLTSSKKKGSTRSIRGENEEEEYVMKRQKTQYSLRKLKPSQSMGNTLTHANLLKIKAPYFTQSEPTKREEILDQCIKQMKKQIYYRNLNLKESNKIHFDESEQVLFDKFTKTDKKQLIFRLMGDPEILEDFYRFIFAKKKAANQSSPDISATYNGLDKLALSKGVDHKFNTKMLAGFKAEFDKRIFDIKANRI